MKKIVLFLALSLGIEVSNSQGFEAIILASDDASLLAEKFIDPVMNGLIYSINGGWYTTAKTHKKLGFDLTINLNAAFVPRRDEVFDFNPSDYTFLSLPDGQTQLPTVMSDLDQEATIDVVIPVGDGTFKVASFDFPGGIREEIPINAVPTPMVQLGFGLPLKTDIKLRFVPKLNFDDKVGANLIGLGLQHDITQYFKPIDKLPLNISLLAAFTDMKVTYDIDDNDAMDNIRVTNGEAEFRMNAWTFQAIASLDFKIISLYGGFGYNYGTSTIRMKGNYGLTYNLEDSNGNLIGTIDESINDPINLDFSATGIRGTIGARINIGFFKIFADYTAQNYNNISGGIAFSFR
ncbi:DUF6588 family protein [Ichthyenterobacterium sp. W332]|uniref:DUF6588 family protein n=1 Tax=Microcosmobacter mediterraneus TaxID=3075607 RepID=A0ABU2YN87_9FLAO|nr:DUF6588 family protein [Ichthyenterobacterium sp. W332]MDT0559628.1 DUF6588 family protein [Ichthyenterobacterium sp. W332]